MTIIQREKDGVMELSIAGRLDAVSAVEADKDFGRVIDAGHESLLVDLDRLEYISSAGLRVLLVVAKRMQQNGGKVALCALSPNVREVFEISGFSSIFTIFPTNNEAQEFLNA
ncbi:MAG: STAS domain-containing protein [Victivallaceae bacterium]|nr:STAS domain-containing protein [Victivallaceae bacterium]